MTPDRKPDHAEMVDDPEQWILRELKRVLHVKTGCRYLSDDPKEIDDAFLNGCPCEDCSKSKPLGLLRNQ